MSAKQAREAFRRKLALQAHKTKWSENIAHNIWLIAKETGWTYDHIKEMPVWAFEQTLVEMEWFHEQEKIALNGGSGKNLTLGR